jgi:hypothetical protein
MQPLSQTQPLLPYLHHINTYCPSHYSLSSLAFSHIVWQLHLSLFFYFLFLLCLHLSSQTHIISSISISISIFSSFSNLFSVRRKIDILSVELKISNHFCKTNFFNLSLLFSLNSIYFCKNNRNLIYF